MKAIETTRQTSFRAFIKRHAVLTYFTLVFALSCGLHLIIILIAGPQRLPGHQRRDIHWRLPSSGSVTVSGIADRCTQPRPWQASL